MKEMGESSTKLNNKDNQMGNYNNEKRKVLQINNGNPTPKNTTTKNFASLLKKETNKRWISYPWIARGWETFILLEL